MLPWINPSNQCMRVFWWPGVSRKYRPCKLFVNWRGFRLNPDILGRPLMRKKQSRGAYAPRLCFFRVVVNQEPRLMVCLTSSRALSRPTSPMLFWICMLYEMEGKWLRKRLLLEQQLGDYDPEAEQSYEGGTGENGFHRFCLLRFSLCGYSGAKLFRENVVKVNFV